MLINFTTIEKLIFSDESIYHLLPSYFFSYFEQWKLSKRIPMLRSLGKTAILDCLNQLNDDHIDILEDYFGERIVIEKLNYNIINNFKIPISEKDLCEQLCGMSRFNNFNIWRDNTHLYISFWH